MKKLRTIALILFFPTFLSIIVLLMVFVMGEPPQEFNWFLRGLIGFALFSFFFYIVMWFTYIGNSKENFMSAEELEKGKEITRKVRDVYEKAASKLVMITYDEEKYKEKIKNLEHFRDSSVGLWCIDRNPKEVTKRWIEKNAFQLKD